MALRDGLGVYGRAVGVLPEFGLNLHDLGELIRRAGWDAGFVVETEWRVPGPDNQWIDWVWLDPALPTVPVVAFEIEGPAVPRKKSLDRDEMRFAGAGAAIEIIALYHVDHDRTVRDPHVANPVGRVVGLMERAGVRVVLDADLFRPGGIEAIQQDALAALALRQGQA